MLQSISCCVLTNFTFFLIGLNRFLHATLSAITNIFNRTFKLSVTAIVIATTNDVRIIVSIKEIGLIIVEFLKVVLKGIVSRQSHISFSAKKTTPRRKQKGGSRSIFIHQTCILFCILIGLINSEYIPFGINIVSLATPFQAVHIWTMRPCRHSQEFWVPLRNNYRHPLYKHTH